MSSQLFFALFQVHSSMELFPLTWPSCTCIPQSHLTSLSFFPSAILWKDQDRNTRFQYQNSKIQLFILIVPWQPSLAANKEKTPRWYFRGGSHYLHISCPVDLLELSSLTIMPSASTDILLRFFSFFFMFKQLYYYIIQIPYNSSILICMSHAKCINSVVQPYCNLILEHFHLQKRYLQSILIASNPIWP